MADGELLSGQQFDRRNNIVTRFTEQTVERAEVETLLGADATEIIPKDAAAALVRRFSDPSTALAKIVRRLAGTIHMSRGQLPDTLVSIETVFNHSEQAGENIQDGALVQASGSHGHANPQASASAQAGAGVIPDIQPVIRETPGDAVPCEHVFFYMPGNVTRAQVLARLSAAVAPPDYGVYNAPVLSWPLFRPVSHTFTLKGQQGSVRAEALARQLAEYDASGSAGYELLPGNDPDNLLGQGARTGRRADGFSKEISLNSRLVNIAPTIHGAITLSDTSLSKTASVSVRANLDPLFGTVPMPGVTNEPEARTITATGEILPATLPATGSQTAIPTSGLYLVELAMEFYDFDNAFVHAAVIDASVFA